MKKIAFVLAFLIFPSLSLAREKDDDLAYRAFEQGRAAYAVGQYTQAVAHFERACNHALIFTSAYYIWLGTACEHAYDTGQDAPNRAVRFDGGYNMRCAIYRLKGLRHSKEEEADRAIRAMQHALIYARSDTSRAALYLDMAFTAYRDDLPKAVEYAKHAYGYNQYEPRVCDTYGGLSLSLASVKLKEGAYREAISTIYPVTTFGWQDRGEALITLAIAYFNSDLQNVGARAYQAAEMAYRIAPERYWEEFHRIAKSQGNYVQARQLEKKHSSALLSKKQDTSP